MWGAVVLSFVSDKQQSVFGVERKFEVGTDEWQFVGDGLRYDKAVVWVGVSVV